MVRIRIGQSGSGRRPDGGGAGPGGCAGRVGGTLFFLVFLAMGLLFCFFIGRETLGIAATRSWTPTPCVIERSGVEPDGDGYRVDVAYRYDFAGATRRGESYNGSTDSDSSYADVARLAERYPPGSEATCFVNPANPDEAILAHRSMAFAFVMLLPLVFVAVGAGGVYGVWRSAAKAETPRSNLASASSGRIGRIAGPIVLVVLAIVGGVLTWFFTVGTLGEYVAAKSWPATPCVVESSRLRSHDSDDGTTYSIDILYRYVVDGRDHRSNRYSFIGGSSSGHKSKQAVVDRHKPGTRTVCYVDPRDPTNAVLHRDFSWMLLLTLIPLIPLAIGVIGLVSVARRSGADRDARAGRAVGERTSLRSDRFESRRDARRDARPGPVALKPNATRLVKLIGLSVFALFWNGIVSVFVYHAYVGGEGGVFMKLFIIPFVLVGLGVIGAVFWTLLSLLNARVVLTLSAAEVAVGGTVRLDWDLVGRIASIQRLRVTLEGREEATYRRGTDTITDRHVFARLVVADTTDRSMIDRGGADLAIPRDTMHSFAESNNKIVWSLRVHGEIPRWPDIDEEYPITVLPRVEGGAA